jgi:hypothetical protein
LFCFGTVFPLISLNVPLFLLSGTICILTKPFQTWIYHLTSIECALGRLIVPSVVPTT